MRNWRRYFGDRDFYRMVLTVTLPIMIQNGITNFVSLLDNIMVGQVGTEPMSGVAIVNQLLMIYNLCIFGAVSGPGIFTAQYYGQGNDEGIRCTFRYKLWITGMITVLVLAAFGTSAEPFVRLYLQGDAGAQDMQATLSFAMEYMRVMLLGLPPFMLVNVYAGTLRETGETVVPMKAGITAVFVNLVLNYILIFGKFGVPALGVVGAGIATVISRYAEAAIVIAWTHRHGEQNRFVRGLYRTMRIPGDVVRRITVKGMPLMVNEALWSAGMAMLMQCYSIRGLGVVAGMNIANTIGNLFNVAFASMGNAVAIIVGQLLGAGRMKEARETDTKLIVFAVTMCFGIGAVMALGASPLFPRLYNTTADVRHMASVFIFEAACFMPMNAFLHATYFTLRSGGRTIVTFLFDSVFLWTVSVPVAFSLSRFTPLPIYGIYLSVMSADLIKCAIGFVLVKKGVWIQNIVAE